MSGRRPGPQPKPHELRVLEGNPGRRPMPRAPEAELPDGVPSPPSGLGPAGLEAWDLYWRGGRLWLSVADQPAIVRACKLTDRAAALEAAIEAEGFLVVNRRTKRSAVHAGFNHLLGIYRSIAIIEQTAGLPATERSRVSPTQSKGDEIDQWMKGTGS